MSIPAGLVPVLHQRSSGNPFFLTAIVVVMEMTGEHWWAAETYRLKGELLLQQGVADAVEVEACFQPAIDIAQQQQARAWQLRASMSLARLWHNQGQWEAGRQLLRDLYRGFSEGLHTADLREARRLLEALTAISC